MSRSNSTIARSKTSMSFHHPTNTNAKQPATTRVRPQTAMSTRKTEEPPPSPEKQNCMMPPPSRSGSIQGRKIRKAASIHSMGQQASTSQREVSISSMMGKLSLEDERAYSSLSQRSQVISDKENWPPAPVQVQVHVPVSAPAPAPARLSLRSSNQHITLRQSRNSRPEGSGNDTVSPPKTPPHSTKHALKVLDEFEDTLFTSTKKYTQSPTKSFKKQPFLTKDSNTRAFTAWDMDVRLIEVEAQFKQMKEVMNISLKDKTHMEEVIEMAKARGRRAL